MGQNVAGDFAAEALETALRVFEAGDGQHLDVEVEHPAHEVTVARLVVAYRAGRFAAEMRILKVGKAAEELKKIGLLLGEITEATDKEAGPGIILSQTPKQGSEVFIGSEVKVSVSVPGLPLVPRLLDIPFEDAKHMIEASGYKLGSVLFVSNPSHARGVVYQQEPIPDSPAQVGTVINIIVNEKP